MKSNYAEEIDYDHRDPGPDLTKIWECRWDNAIAANEEAQLEFPLHYRRERLDRTSNIRHWHTNFLALYIVRSGRGTRTVNDRAHSLARGDIFLMAPDNTHSFRGPMDLILDAIYFNHELWSAREWEALELLPDLAAFFAAGSEGFAARGHTDYFGHLSPEPHAQVEAVLAAMRRELKQKSLPLHLAARARFFALLVQLAQWRAAKAFTAGPARGAAIAEVLHFCDGNFHRPLSIEQLAGMMHVSRAKFFNVFVGEVGMPPAAYLRRLRLQHAQKLLEDRSLLVADIARLSGFGDATQLARAFRKAFGISPSEFREDRRISSGLPIFS